MENNLLENNSVILIGKVSNEKKFSHEIYGEKFYTFDISVPRLSGSADEIPVTISERLFKDDDLKVNKSLKVTGQFRSYNSYEGEKNKLFCPRKWIFLKHENSVIAEKKSIENNQYDACCKRFCDIYFLPKNIFILAGTKEHQSTENQRGLFPKE